MTRKQVLIALVSVLSVALATVVTGILTGFLPGTEQTAASPPVAPPTAPAVSASAGPVQVIGGEQADEQARYVGTSEDGEYTVAVIVWSTSAIAHVTDGASREAWVKGTAGGDQLLLAGMTDAVLNAEVKGGKLAGSATFNQNKVKFSIPQVQAPAGIYRASGEVNGQKVRVGVIVLPDQQPTGIEWVNGKPSPVRTADLSGQTVHLAGADLRLEAIKPGDV